MTQEELTSHLGLKVTDKSIGTYERGESFPDPETLWDMLYYFDYPYEVMTQTELEEMTAEERESLRVSAKINVKTKILAVTTDTSGQENIAFVPERAAAGYTMGYSDSAYMQQLEGFRLPWLPETGSYRAFEIKGDSMLPLGSGSIIVGRYIEQPSDLRRGERYVVISKEGIVYKRIYHSAATSSSTQSQADRLLLVSDNSLYEPYEMRTDDVLEFWETYATIEMKGKR